MELTRDKLERLIFKHLLNQARIQKDLDRPLCSTAILTLHDCVECFLYVACEFLTGKAKTGGNNILELYIDEINNFLLKNNKILVPKAYIIRLNNNRNNAKHATIFVDSQLVKNIYFETESFINDYMQTIF